MKSVLLISSDVPVGWVDAGAVKSSNGTSSFDKQLQSKAAKFPVCKSFLAQSTADKQLMHLASNLFQEPTVSGSTGHNELSNEATGYPSEDAAKAAYAAVSSADTEACLGHVFHSIAAVIANQVAQQSGVTPQVSVAFSRAPVPGVGDATTGYQAIISVSLSGQSIQIAMAMQLVRQGPYGMTYTATYFHKPPHNALGNSVQRSISRLQAAIAAG